MHDKVLQRMIAGVLPSLALVCVPVAFQIVAGLSQPVPEGLRIALVLSVWAGLMAIAVGVGLSVALLRWVSARVREVRRHRRVWPVAW